MELFLVTELSKLIMTKIGSTVAFPAAGYICMAIEAAHQVTDEQNRKTILQAIKAGETKTLHRKILNIHSYELTDLRIKAALTLSDDAGVETLFELRPIEWTNDSQAEHYFGFKVTSVSKSSDSWSTHAVGNIRIRPVGYGKHRNLEIISCSNVLF